MIPAARGETRQAGSGPRRTRGYDRGGVSAAGGVVWRRAKDGTVEGALVHRPAYDDWALAKGKLNPW